MAFAGLKKQLNKANQYMSEKMGAAEGTKLTEEYLDMEKKTDVTMELVDEMINKTKEYLQPNPATRAKMQLSNRVQTGGRSYGYTQPEGVLGDSMLRSAKKLGDNVFAQSLIETGEALKQMSEIKFSLEDNIKQNFLDPLTYLQNKEIKDVNFHRKKLESRRLDYDCKKRRKPTSQAEQVDLSLAQAKFEQSLNLASQGMHNLLQNQTEHINQLTALSQALHEYHLQCSTILEGLTSRLNEKKNIAANQPQEAFVPKKLDDLKGVTINQNEGSNFSSNNDLSKENGLLMNFNTDSTPINLISESQNKKTPTLTNQDNASLSSQSSDNTPEVNRAAPVPPNNKGNNKIPAVPCCKALYDFEPENPTELAFEEGDIIEIKEKIDENWFEGTLKGKTGLFPIAYVTILVPINK